MVGAQIERAAAACGGLVGGRILASVFVLMRCAPPCCLSKLLGASRGLSTRPPNMGARCACLA
eukprot:570769-Alexandrium_andersonii.AAC.1